MVGPDGLTLPGKAAPFPRPAELADTLARSFGLTGTMHPLGGEATLNLRLESGSRVHAVKVGSVEHAGAQMEREAAILGSVGVAELEWVTVPALVRTRQGECLAEATNDDGDRFRVMVTSFMDGDLMDPRRDPSRVGRRVGAALADLDRVLVGVDLPSSGPTSAWSLLAAGDLLKLPAKTLSDAGVDEQSARIERACRALLPGVATLPRQWIHHDVNPSNTFIPAGDVDPIGVIDFGDADVAPRVVDLAIACAYLVDVDAASTDPFGAVREFVAGYQSILPLADAELTLVPDLMALRYAMAITITRVQAVREPANRDYLLRNTRFALMRQELLDTVGRDRLGAELREVSAGY